MPICNLLPMFPVQTVTYVPGSDPLTLPRQGGGKERVDKSGKTLTPNPRAMPTASFAGTLLRRNRQSIKCTVWNANSRNPLLQKQIPSPLAGEG